MSPSTGELLDGRYRLMAILGQGGMSSVYRAYDEVEDRTVAVKIIRAGFAASPDYRERFHTETAIARTIDHPNVIPVLDVGYGDELYLVMRLIAGADLGQRLRMVGRIPLPETLRIAVQIAGALETIHAAGLVHRDVKPDNVLLAPIRGRDRAYLTDFGIARSAPADLRSSSFGGLVGSLPYCSPERFEGDPGGRSSDVYGLACVVVECLTGHKPFPGPEFADYRRQHESNPPLRLEGLAAGLPSQLDPVIASGLEKDPDQRPTSPEAWMNDLIKAAEGSGAVAAWTPSPPSTRPVPVAPEAGQVAPSEPEPEPEPEPVPVPVQVEVPVEVPPAVGADDPAPADGSQGPSRAKVVAWSAALVGFLAVATVAGIAINDTSDSPPSSSAGSHSHPAAAKSTARTSAAAGLVGPHSAAQEALFHRVSTLPLGACTATSEAAADRPLGELAVLTCRPGARGVDSVTVRQFDTSAHEVGDAAKRPVEQGVTTTFFTCDPNGNPPNNGRIAGYGDWSRDGRQGYLQCYPQTRSGGRALVWTYDADAIEMAAVNTKDSSPQAATALFTWWNAKIRPTPLAPKP